MLLVPLMNGNSIYDIYYLLFITLHMRRFYFVLFFMSYLVFFNSTRHLVPVMNEESLKILVSEACKW